MTESAQERVNAFFFRATARPTAEARFSTFADAAPQTGRFSVFIGEDMAKAIALADALAEAAKVAAAAGASDDEALNAALAVADAARRTSPAAMVDHAVMLFLTHSPSARNVRIPNLMSRMAVSARHATMAEAVIPELGGTTFSAEEDKLGWFREDPLANEHHEHWHLVYVRFDGANFKVRDRHGELFFYMHQQMLARYDTERLAVGLPRVAAYEDYTQPIGVGYEPGGLQIGETDFEPRAADAVWVTVNLGDAANPLLYSPAQHMEKRDHLLAGIAMRQLVSPGTEPVALEGHKGSDILGHTEESGQHAVGGGAFTSHFGNHHGFGHVLTAALSMPNDLNRGVMAFPAAAIRDPFFWRWHKHVDDLNFHYQEQLEPHSFDDAPLVEFGGGDDRGIAILPSEALVFADQQRGIAAEDIAATVLGGDAFTANAATGGAQIDIGGGQTLPIAFTDTLETQMRRGLFQLETEAAADEEPRFSYPYLWHPSYHFAVRLRSTGAAQQNVTIRLFLCPAFAVDGIADASLNDRRLWIELDKFAADIDPGAEAVFIRADTASTIVRRPVTSVTANPDFVRDLNYGAQGDQHPDAAACECGWPYHLLYPRGTTAGMRFALLAIVTTGDRLMRQGHCGSMSFCAVTDEYPDIRPMGYPFDRPLGQPLAELVAGNPTMAMRFITIRENSE